MKQPAVYILANKKNGTLYIGVTSDLIKRIYSHKQKYTGGFTKKYSCDLLVYFEFHGDMYTAITREKQLKSGSRINKIKLIEKLNPEWKDLWAEIL